MAKKKKTSKARTRKPVAALKGGGIKKALTRVVAKALGKKPTPTKRTAAKLKGSNGHPAGEQPIRPAKLKSPLTARELREFKQLLMVKRAEILGDMKSMSHDALNSDSANLSHMPLHMADVGSDNYEQELTLGLVESERRLLHEIEEALARIGDGTYGICEATGKPITRARLNAKPWAKYCIEAAREFERHGGRRL